MSKYGFKASYNRGDIQKRFAEFAKRIHMAIVVNLQYLGEECVLLAREQGNYTDHTGNLRNSIGYVLVHDGTVISQNFEERIQSKIISKVNGAGVLEGKKLADELMKRFTKGYALIVVAGMNYAYYVETQSKDVLDSAERYALQKKPRMMKMLKEQVYKAVV